MGQVDEFPGGEVTFENLPSFPENANTPEEGGREGGRVQKSLQIRHTLEKGEQLRSKSMWVKECVLMHIQRILPMFTSLWRRSPKHKASPQDGSPYPPAVTLRGSVIQASLQNESKTNQEASVLQFAY